MDSVEERLLAVITVLMVKLKTDEIVLPKAEILEILESVARQGKSFMAEESSKNIKIKILKGQTPEEILESLHKPAEEDTIH